MLHIFSNTLIDFNGWEFIRVSQSENEVLGNGMLLGQGKKIYAEDMVKNIDYSYLKNITLLNGRFHNNVRNTNDEVLARFPHGDYITLYNMRFIGQTKKHQVVFAGCSHVIVKQCVFDGGYDGDLTGVAAVNYEALHLDWVSYDWNGGRSEGYGACVKDMYYDDPRLTPNEKQGVDGSHCREVYVSDNRFEGVQTGMGSHEGYNIPSINFASSVSELSHPNDNDDNEVLKMIVAKKRKKLYSTK